MRQLIITMEDDDDIRYETVGDFNFFELFGLIECFKMLVYQESNEETK
jgi:hypothetical protein